MKKRILSSIILKNQYVWNLFHNKSREKIIGKLVDKAQSYRQKHPEKNLKVPFCPKSALSGFRGMNNYDNFLRADKPFAVIGSFSWKKILKVKRLL